MKYYAVIDTNVIVSAFIKFNSIPGAILTYVFEGLIKPLLSDAIIEEYRTVLSREKFHISKDEVESFIELIESIGLYIDPVEVDEEFTDQDDKKFYELAVAKQKYYETYLITGNIVDFPSKFFVVTPRQMLEIISQDFER